MAWCVIERADVAIAVATKWGLITPIIFGGRGEELRSDRAVKMRALSERARAGQLQPDEYNGGTFTVSNLGMYGITSFALDHQSAARRDSLDRGREAHARRRCR